MSTIQVRLDVNANPPVTVQPNPFSVNRGKAPIKWERAAQQQFTFVSVSGLPQPPFSPKSQSDTEVTMDDDNQSTQSFSYKVVVSLNGTQYSTDGSLTGASGGTQAKATVAASKPLIAGPIIQNK